MIFHEKYELLALHGGDREIALPGRETSSGRDVQVHLLTAGYTRENRELLATIDKLPAEHRLRVLDKGDHEGIPYVVTEVLPPSLRLREWLAAAKSAVPSSAPTASPARRGVWRIPAVTEAPANSAAPASEPGEFTRLSQPVKEPEQVRRSPTMPDEMPTAAIVVPNLDQKTPATPSEPEPGEFTRILHAAAPPAATPAVTQAATRAEPAPGEFTRVLHSMAAQPGSVPTAAIHLPPAVDNAAAAAQPEPGEFTRILHSAAPPPASTPTAGTPLPPPAEVNAAAPAQPEPGEFTRILHSAAPPPALPTAAIPLPPSAEIQAAAPAAPEPGEFTRAFQTRTPVPPVMPRASASQSSIPVPPTAPTPAPRPAAPGEFTGMMQSPLAAGPVRPQPVVPPAQSASEFTRMMQAGQFTDAPPRQVPLPGPAATPPPSGRSLQTPGEFTRMFSTEPEPSENLAAPAAPQAPLPHGGLATGAFSRSSAFPQPQAGSGPGEYTQMFGTRPPATAAKTSAPQPAPPAPKADRSYLPLILILAGLFLLVVIIVVVFALTR